MFLQTTSGTRLQFTFSISSQLETVSGEQTWNFFKIKLLNNVSVFHLLPHLLLDGGADLLVGHLTLHLALLCADLIIGVLNFQ